MKERLHGVLSISFALASFILANVKLYWVSTALGIGYSIFLLMGMLMIMKFFCTKCPHLQDNTCRHITVGPLVLKFFGGKEPGKYTVGERLAADIPVLLGILAPQYWLFQDLRFLIPFWMLTVVYFLEITYFVCPQCLNVYCEVCPNKGKTL